MGFWMDNAMEEGKDNLVDCGYVGHPKTREHVDALVKLVSKSNVEIVYCGRVLVRIPKAKLKNVISCFPEIKEGKTYAWCTHHWSFEGFNCLDYALK